MKVTNLGGFLEYCASGMPIGRNSIFSTLIRHLRLVRQNDFQQADEWTYMPLLVMTVIRAAQLSGTIR